MAMQWPLVLLGIPLLLAGGWVYAERPRFLFRRQDIGLAISLPGRRRDGAR